MSLLTNLGITLEMGMDYLLGKNTRIPLVQPSEWLQCIPW